jgi:2-polyprenyl-6-methoxyphenol hydroxylase-like FAD-dependent oxidoreductase
MKESEVLIAGAGPTGLVLALWLDRLGVGVRVIDKASGPGTTSRALAVQARTLELYRQLGLDTTVVAAGHKIHAFNLWVNGERRARLPLADIGAGLTPYPFLLVYPQDEHERLLEQRLAARGITVERDTELTGLSEQDGLVTAQLRHGDGSASSHQSRYLAGCDGARSAVRRLLDIGFPGGTYPHLFYVADIEGSGPAMNGELHADLEEADFLAVFAMAQTGHARLVGTVRDERAQHAETLRFDDVSSRAIHNLKIEVRKVNWFSTYHVHHRVANGFRRGRVFLAGDAGHIHSPAGGQGMNTGIGDAINLAWKLAAVLRGRAGEALLDTYEQERIGFAHRLVDTTDRVFTFATADGPIADVVRTRVAPMLAPLVGKLTAGREFLFRTASQIMIHYRHSALSQGGAGRVRGGDRLPWVPVAEQDNFQPLSRPGWQVHVYGVPAPGLESWCERHAVPLHAFDWTPEHHSAGLVRDALYLLRPDTYVAMVSQEGDGAALERYFTSRQMLP